MLTPDVAVRLGEPQDAGGVRPDVVHPFEHHQHLRQSHHRAIDEMRLAGLALERETLFERGTGPLVVTASELDPRKPLECERDLPANAELTPHRQRRFHPAETGRLVSLPGA